MSLSRVLVMFLLSVNLLINLGNNVVKAETCDVKEDTIIRFNNTPIYVRIEGFMAESEYGFVYNTDPCKVVRYLEYVQEYFLVLTGKDDLLRGLREVTIYPQWSEKSFLGLMSAYGEMTVYRSFKNDGIDTILHELGHYIDFLFITDELRDEYKILRGVDIDSDWRGEDLPWNSRLIEAFAEDVRYLLVHDMKYVMNKKGLLLYPSKTSFENLNDYQLSLFRELVTDALNNEKPRIIKYIHLEKNLDDAFDILSKEKISIEDFKDIVEHGLQNFKNNRGKED